MSLTNDGGAFDRRRLLHGAAAAPLFYAGDVQADEEAGRAAFPGLIVQQSQPLNLEYPFPALNSFLVPNNEFFVRSHFNVPEIDAKNWRLRIEGEVKNPLELTIQDLRQMQSRTLP